MLKHAIVAFGVLVICGITYAETCPSVSEIKSNALKGWRAYDSDDGKPLSLEREKEFRKILEKFVLAEWTNTKKQLGSIHCYYTDKTGSSLEAYFAKDNFHPKLDNKSFWYEVSGYMHCAASMDRCEFINPLAAKTHLAMKGKIK